MTAEIILSFFPIALIISKAVKFCLFFLLPFKKNPANLLLIARYVNIRLINGVIE